MAVALSLGDRLLMRVACQCNDQIAINDYGYRVANVTGSPTLEEIVAAVDTIAAARYRAIQAASTNFYGISVIREQPTASQPVVTSNLRAGLFGSNTLPRQVSGLISKVTATGGRTGRGRVYIPFLGDGNVDSFGHIQPAQLVFFNQLALDLLATNNYSGLSGACDLVPHLRSGGRPPIYTAMVGYTLRAKTATQRRRGDFGRPNSLPW